MNRFAPSLLSACLAAASIGLLVACGATTPAAVPEQPAALTFATFGNSGETTVQGGAIEAFAYSEKPGDAILGSFATADGVARVSGTIGARNGSTWGGIALMSAGGADGKTIDLSKQRTLHIRLASASATQLRVRVIGNDKATRENGCYPVVVQKVTPELKDYAIPMSLFAPETYCAAQGRTIVDTAPAVAAIEVSDATLSAAPRPANFRVGRIELRR